MNGWNSEGRSRPEEPEYFDFTLVVYRYHSWYRYTVTIKISPEIVDLAISMLKTPEMIGCDSLNTLEGQLFPTKEGDPTSFLSSQLKRTTDNREQSNLQIDEGHTVLSQARVNAK